MKHGYSVYLVAGVLVALATSVAHAQTPRYAPPIVTGTVESMARGTQYPHGAYDQRANRTFVVFPGCGGENPCPSDPYLMIFDHDDQTWSRALKLDDSPEPEDSHYFPQVIIDKRHHVHVFHGLHARHPIRHYRSRYRSDSDKLKSASGWERVQRFTFRPAVDAATLDLTFNRATYPLPIKSQDGTLFLFYRNTIKSQKTDRGDWYEVVFYTYSRDSGSTWIPPQQVIVPTTEASCNPRKPVCDDEIGPNGRAPEEWDAAVIGGWFHDQPENRLHLLFSVSKHKNVYVDKTYYAVIDLGLNNANPPRPTILSPTGKQLGPFIHQDHMEDARLGMVALDLPGTETEFARVGPRSVVGVDHQGRPHVFGKYGKIGYPPKSGDIPVQLVHRRWDGKKWTPEVCIKGRASGCQSYSDTAVPQSVVFHRDGSFELYVLDCALARNHCRQLRMHKSPYFAGWSESVLHANERGDFYNFMTPVRDHHPDHQSTFFEVHWSGWDKPRPTGKLFTVAAGDDLLVVEKNPGKGQNTQLRVLHGDQGFTGGSGWVSTALHKTGRDLAWTFAYGDQNGDGKRDLYAIKRKGTGSGKTEVHVLDSAHGFSRFLVQTGTALHETGDDLSWEFELADYNRDGHLDLYAIKRADTESRRTEVHILDGARQFGRFLLQKATALETAGRTLKWQFGVGDANGDGVPDVYAIKRAETGSKKVEVHILDGASDYARWYMQLPTEIDAVGTSGIWTFEVGDDNRDGVPDLYALKRTRTGSGNMHLSVLDGASRFGVRMLGSRTGVRNTGRGDDWAFLVGRR